MHFYYRAHVLVAPNGEENETNTAKRCKVMHSQTKPRYKRSNMYNIQYNHVQKLFYTQVLKNVHL